jgi:hypothetical protein
MTAGSAREQAFLLSGFSSQPGTGHATVISFGQRQRWRRALTGLGKWWAVALGAVFIPVAHFLLVPSFFLYGVLQFFQRLGTAELTRDARGTCPDCGTEQQLELSPRWRAPQQVSCRHCHRGLKLVLPSS